MCASVPDLPYRSRFQVLTDGTPAWALDEKRALYRFDGLRFSRCRKRDESFTIVPSWQTPSYGWLCPSDCPVSVLIEATEPAQRRAAMQPGSGLVA